MIRGWFMDIPSWRSRDGTRILEFGLAVLTSRSESVLASVGSVVLDGDGVIGDSIGITTTQSTATAGTTLEAELFITEAVTTEQEASEA
jgi:hypothetical protein